MSVCQVQNRQSYQNMASSLWT